MHYQSTKTYGHEVGLSACFRQWRAQSHCRFLHGYALSFKLTFQAQELDVRNWVVDFGSLKSFKGMLEDQFDHKTLVAYDDPLLDIFHDLDQAGLIQLRLVPDVGCEAFARLAFGAADVWLGDAGYKPRVEMHSVEVREHSGNSAIYLAGASE